VCTGIGLMVYRIDWGPHFDNTISFKGKERLIVLMVYRIDRDTHSRKEKIKLGIGFVKGRGD